MPDVKESDLPKITNYSDIKELRLIKTDGSSVSMTVENFINAVAEKIARVDGFASVVAELIGNGYKSKGYFSDANKCVEFGYYYQGDDSPVNVPGESYAYSTMIVLPTIWACLQLYIVNGTGALYSRTKKNNGTWNAWVKLL